MHTDRERHSCDARPGHAVVTVRRVICAILGHQPRAIDLTLVNPWDRVRCDRCRTRLDRWLDRTKPT